MRSLPCEQCDGKAIEGKASARQAKEGKPKLSSLTHARPFFICYVSLRSAPSFPLPPLTHPAKSNFVTTHNSHLRVKLADRTWRWTATHFTIRLLVALPPTFARTLFSADIIIVRLVSAYGGDNLFAQLSRHGEK
ncbi:hypothetical protein GOP47_0020062 [Adiantum capillus-veneris]|uniref:Uncharacterized protein n=1 Tax=Adiantum capillus-veneris TaxID=13818 RepID=A0A9D4UCY6_ADICA|nr:hypothetical protein GOP47_0020062 [Adiantum capillus-veneris]